MNKSRRQSQQQLFDQKFREFRARNILTIEERVAVIGDYEKNPVYQRLAEKYKCSTKQIKNILANRDAVMLYYNNRLADGSTSNERRQRQLKIAFLGKVVYEFIQRAVYHGIHLDTTSVRRKALEIKESIAIVNFYPNNAWMQNFKTQYDVPEFDLMKLRQVMFLDEAKEDCFNAVELIQYVSKREKMKEQHAQQQSEERQLKLLPGPPPLQKIDIRRDEQQDHTADLSEPTVTYECLSDVSDSYVDGDGVSNRKRKWNTTQDSLLSLDDDDESGDLSAAIQPEPLQPLPDIASCQEALRHLQVLEDYAMLSDNFRAIGLITQLQQVFREPPRSDDFLD